MLLSLVLAVSPVVQPVSSATMRDGGTAISVRTQGEAQTVPGAYYGTLFGHTRVAHPYTLGDVVNQYGYDPEVWAYDGGGVLTQLPNEAALLLDADGGLIELETHRKFRYQAARQQTILQTLMLPTAADAGVVRWGNFCFHDGLYWQYDLGGLKGCRRTSAEDGGVNDYCDTIDAGASWAPQNGNIYEIRFAWLGVHEYDFWLNGRNVLSRNFDGLLPQVYMGTATLPLRAEATNRARVKYVCSNVTSEGGQAPPSPGFSQVRATTKTVSAAAGILPIIALRPSQRATFNGLDGGVHSHGELVPTSISCQSSTPGNTRIYSYLNPTTLTDATWAISPTSSAAQVDVAATAVAGGTQVCTFGAAEGTHELHHVFGMNQRSLRNRALGEPADVLVIAADSISGNQAVTCAVEWQEVR